MALPVIDPVCPCKKSVRARHNVLPCQYTFGTPLNDKLFFVCIHLGMPRTDTKTVGRGSGGGERSPHFERQKPFIGARELRRAQSPLSAMIGKKKDTENS